MTFSSWPAGMIAACRWAAPINGAISSTVWSSAGASITESMFGLTTPLITTAGGAKMGKTAAGAVWLNPDRLSPYDYWQYWRDTSDADVGRFLRMFTDLPLDEIERLEALKGQEINAAKITPGDRSNRHGPWPRRSGRGRRNRSPDLRRGRCGR